MSNGRTNLPLQRLSDSGVEIRKETVVEECAIQLTAINNNGNIYCHTTLLATPIDLIELHIGHLYSEGYVDDVPSINHFELTYHGISRCFPRFCRFDDIYGFSHSLSELCL